MDIQNTQEQYTLTFQEAYKILQDLYKVRESLKTLPPSPESSDRLKRVEGIIKIISKKMKWT